MRRCRPSLAAVAGGRGVDGFGVPPWPCDARCASSPRGAVTPPRKEDQLYDQFGGTSQWIDSLHPFLWTHVSTAVPPFVGSTEVDLPDRLYLRFRGCRGRLPRSLADGEIPLVLLFSGTVFSRGPNGLSVEPIPWDVETSYRMPVALWRQAMDTYFPNSSWLRVDRHTFLALRRFRAERGLPTWDQVAEQLLAAAAERVP